MFRPRLTLSALALSIWAVAPASLAAQTADELFDPQAVHEIRITINSRDYRRLREDVHSNTYYTADFQWRGMKIRNVGVRNRGVGSRNPQKLGLRVDFNRYTKGQTFLGLRALVLDNVWQDGSFIAERVAMALFERLGQPTPRESFARVYINSVFQGLYAIVESVDEPFLSRTLGGDQGYLFSFQHQGHDEPWRAEYLGDEYRLYKRFFEPETHQLEADAIVYGPIRELFREVNGPEDAVWRERVEQYVDLWQFVRHVAIEVFLAEGDGFLGSAGMNNYFLYRPAGTNVHRWIPWDKDSALLDSRFGIFTRADENVLFRRALAFSDLRTHYLNVLEECAQVAATDGWLLGQVEQLAALAEAPAREDTLKQFSTEAWAGAVDLIRQFAIERPAFVAREVARARGN
jgi:spore coat protein CotH